MTTILINNTTDGTKGIINMISDPNLNVTDLITIEGWKYEVRTREEQNNQIEYMLSDSGVTQ